ncbi:MAG: cytochrome c [Planctomycetota bacterium]
MTSLVRFFACLVFGAAVADTQAEGPKRARPPAWTDDQRDLFPADARELLVGPRPDFAAQKSQAVASGGNSSSEDAVASYKWSDLVAAETVETEIKRQAMQVQQLVQSATSFKGGGYREARDAFSVLAVMFSIAAEYDGDARWQDSAAGLSALFSRAGANCKVGTDGTFREAAARSEDLAELIRGGRPDVPNAPPDRTWGDVADRSPLMRRMEVCQQERISPLMGSEREFSRGAEDAQHEAEVLAALAEVIIREGFDDADDDEYAAHSRRLRDAAADLSQAAEQDNYESARQALGQAGQACSACHDEYRG